MATKVIQMMEKTADGYDELIPIGAGIVIRVTAEAGSTVTCAFEGKSQVYTYTADGTYDFYGWGYGKYTITSRLDTFTKVVEQDVLESKLYEISALTYAKLEKYTWAQISEISAQGTGQNYWSLGDTKMITVNGSIAGGTFNDSYGVFIASFSHNPDVEGSGILFHSFKNNLTEKKDIALFSNFQMNTSNITNGGWRDCYMRKNIIPQFENAISSDLKNVVKTSTIYSHNYTGGSQNDNASHVTATQDRFYLLAEFEIFGARTYANSYEQNHQVQVEYYKLGNSRVKHQSTNPSSANLWWERSVWCNYASAGGFCIVDGSGGAGSNGASSSYGFAVAFRV